MSGGANAGRETIQGAGCRDGSREVLEAGIRDTWGEGKSPPLLEDRKSACVCACGAQVGGRRRF